MRLNPFCMNSPIIMYYWCQWLQSQAHRRVHKYEHSLTFLCTCLNVTFFVFFMKTSMFKVPRVCEDLAHLQPSTAAPCLHMAISAALLHPRSLPCPWSGLNNKHRCRNYDFISFNIVGLKCSKVGQIGEKRGIWVRVNELCRLDIWLNYLLSLWY